MQIKLYNSLDKKVSDFTPVNEKQVTMYSCGPTVYNYAHIGNMRAFLFADLLQRVLRMVGEYDVKWVMNITNIDDKTIRDSSIGSPAWTKEMGSQSDNPMVNLEKLTWFYQEAFINDIKQLGFDTEHFYSMPRATDYIKGMQELVLSLIGKGFAYISEGSVYFNVAEWRKNDTYGKLFKIDFDNFKSGTRVDTDQYEREQVSDFTLWKARKDNEPYWEFNINGEICDGRPGWHIECSVMEKELLGLPFDIHTGGVDLKFPHHEDEIAQSKAGYGIDPTVFWCHNEFLEVEGQKMSKSLGNFFTLRDLILKGIDPRDVRYLMLSAHYASVLNFTFAGLEASGKASQRIQDYIHELFAGTNGNIEVNISVLENQIFSHLANDLQTPKALASIFTFINNNNAPELSDSSKIQLIEFFKKLNNIFAVWDICPKPEIKQDIPDEVRSIAEARVQARKDKNWTLSDELRNQISALGWIIKDSKDGYELKKN